MPFLTMNSITTADGATVLVRYIFEDNTDAAPSEVISGVKGAAYSVTPPAVTGYTPNPAQLTGNFVANPAVEDYFDAVKNIIYTAVTTKYTLTLVVENQSFTQGAALSNLQFSVRGVGSEMPTGTLTVVSTESGVTYTQTFNFGDSLSITRGTALYNRLVSVGSHPYYLEYSGDENYEACTSSTGYVTVSAVPIPPTPDPGPTPTPTP